MVGAALTAKSCLHFAFMLTLFISDEQHTGGGTGLSAHCSIDKVIHSSVVTTADTKRYVPPGINVFLE